MNRFFNFLQKEFYHITRDIRTLVIIICIPIVQLLLFGYVITNDIKNAKMSIYDQSKDEVTRKLIQKLLSSGYFKLDRYIDNYDEINQDFKEGHVKQVIIFENNFAERLIKDGKANVQIISDGSEPNTSDLLVNYDMAIIADFSRELNPIPGSSNNTLSSVPQIIPEVRLYYNPELLSVFMFVPGLMGLLLMLISAMMTSISITREKELGTMEVLLVSPLKPFQIVIGKVIPYILLAFINVILILGLATLVFGLPIRGNMVLLLAESLLYILVALSLGIFISTRTSSQQTAMMISMLGLLLPSLLLSGFIYPIENMPKILQLICYIMPPRYFIIIIKDVMLKGVGFIYIWKETLVLICMMSLFIFLSIKNFKIRLE